MSYAEKMDSRWLVEGKRYDKLHNLQKDKIYDGVFIIGYVRGGATSDVISSTDTFKRLFGAIKTGPTHIR